MSQQTDPYRILGVSSTASDREIRNAYRKLVLNYHPDRNKGSAEAAQKFNNIQSAYEQIKESRQKPLRKGDAQQSEFIFFRTIKDLFKIRIILPKREVIQGLFEVKVFSREKRNDIHLKLPAGIELIKKGIPERIILNTPQGPATAWNTTFYLKGIHTGHFQIGPAWYVQSGTRYITERAFINVYREASYKKKQKGEKQLNRVVQGISIVVMLFIVFILAYNVVMDRVDPERKRRALARDGKVIPDFRLQTGATPYSSFYGENIIDPSSAHQIEFIADPVLDQVVFLTELHSGKVIRHNYVLSNDTFVMNQIPDGTFYIKVFYGRDWDVSNRLKRGKLKGGFNIYRKFISFTEKDQILRMERSTRGDSLAFNAYRITLYKVKGGEAPARNMEEEQFFN
ncbi:MAG: DnaJ domain-containing protein [Chitinophagales bacterium]